MAWYTKNEVREIEGDARAELGLLYQRYNKLVRCHDALEKITAKGIRRDGKLDEIAKDYGLKNRFELDSYQWFIPQLAYYLKDHERLSLAKGSWEEKGIESKEFKALGLYPGEIKRMVNKANKCHVLHGKYESQDGEAPKRIELVDSESSQFPKIIRRTNEEGCLITGIFVDPTGFVRWNYTLGPVTKRPLDSINAGYAHFKKP